MTCCLQHRCTAVLLVGCWTFAMAAAAVYQAMMHHEHKLKPGTDAGFTCVHVLVSSELGM